MTAIGATSVVVTAVRNDHKHDHDHDHKHRIYHHSLMILVAFFGPIFKENFVSFSNARSSFEIIRCNWNVAKLDVLTLLSSDCRTWALKLSKHLKKGQNMFCLHFAISSFNVIFFSIFSKNIRYLKSSINLYDEYLFFLHINNCHKSGGKFDFSYKFNFPWNQLEPLFFEV